MPEELIGIVEKETYHNNETHYSVLRLGTKSGVVTVVGTFVGINPGEELHLTGEWVVHPRFGRQFRAEGQKRTLPVTREGVLRYLSSGVVKGVGPGFAQRLVNHFGADTLRIIAEAPERLSEVPGLGAQRRENLVKSLAAQRVVQDIMVFLHGLGVSPGLAARIYKRYGDKAIDVLRRDPYKLADDIYGVGFRTADRLAQSLGLPHDSVERARAAVHYRLQEASGEGHMCLPLPVLMAEAEKSLDVAPERCKEAVAEMAATGRLTMEGDGETAFVYLPRLHLDERETARLLIALVSTQSNSAQTGSLPILAQGITLSPEQQKAVEQALSGGVTVITGGPGTGKTTILRCILECAGATGRRTLLAAPTGRAAKRLQEATGSRAQTIHRLLEYGFNESSRQPVFQRHAGNPLQADMVVVDEVSMLDVPLAHHLLQAIAPGTALVLVGDADQLPSVGPGSFLRDLVAADVVPVMRLTTVYRQAEESLIVVNAHHINRGEMPRTNVADKDFFHIEEAKTELLAERVKELVVGRLPHYYGFSARDDIQVLTPVRRGAAGVERLNMVLQRALNPAAAGLPADAVPTFLPGDRVMQVRNNYDKMVFNGDIGIVGSIENDTGDLIVQYPDRDEGSTVAYAVDEQDELQLAYAISVHKSQGSEFPVVVMAVPRVSPTLATRNLLYTAVTRAKRLVVLVGEKATLAAYIRNNTAHRRWGQLMDRLVAEWRHVGAGNI